PPSFRFTLAPDNKEQDRSRKASARQIERHSLGQEEREPSERPSTALHPSRNSGPLHGSRSCGFARGFLPECNRLLQCSSGKASRNPAPSADQKRSSWSSARHETAPEAGCLKAMAQAAGLPPERQCCSSACGIPWAANQAPLPPPGQSLPVSSFHLLTVSSCDSAPGLALIRGQFRFKSASISVHLSRRPPRHQPGTCPRLSWVPWICGPVFVFLRASASPRWVLSFSFNLRLFWKFAGFALIRGQFSLQTCVYQRSPIPAPAPAVGAVDLWRMPCFPPRLRVSVVS